ncbi:MAG: hypothetical protein IJD79_00690 [Clostridia bacterium]|nr:hypothetical protein [Clostridia bacterium]
MSKAFCCDNCRELFAGNPCKTDENGNEFCAGCVRVFEAFKMIDPFAFKNEPKPKKCEDTE